MKNLENITTSLICKSSMFIVTGVSEGEFSKGIDMCGEVSLENAFRLKLFQSINP